MKEKYKKYIKNIPFVELIYNFKEAQKQVNQLKKIEEPFLNSENENENKKRKQGLFIATLYIFGMLTILPLYMFFSGFFGFLILHNVDLYLLLLTLLISYYGFSIYKETLDEKTGEYDKLKNSQNEITGLSLIIWSYAYLSIGILMAMLI